MILSNTRTDSYTSKCPYPSERRLRAIGFCHKNNTVQMYSCLFDTNEEQFSEHCNHNPDYSAPGTYNYIPACMHSVIIYVLLLLKLFSIHSKHHMKIRRYGLIAMGQLPTK